MAWIIWAVEVGLKCKPIHVRGWGALSEMGSASHQTAGHRWLPAVFPGVCAGRPPASQHAQPCWRAAAALPLCFHSSHHHTSLW